MSTSSNKQSDTFWLAYIKDGVPVFGKIVLGELVEYSSHLRTIATVDLITGDGTNIYWSGSRTSSDRNPAIYTSKQDAVTSLLGQIDTVISEHNSKVSRLYQGRKQVYDLLSEEEE
jgi:hypothetical protein